MAKNANLHKAKVAKNDEFYTQRVDIENELSHYAEHFKDKVVYCNCDDPETSEFWLFFKRNFKPWGIKRLIATHYEPDAKNYAYVLEISQDTNGDGVVDWKDEPTITPLPCNGDFRSAACIELLKQADIVVTNPPFSCHSSDTEVMTNKGWKPIKDVDISEDRILSLNPDTQVMEMVKAVDYIKSPVNGQLYHFHSLWMDFCVTGNHRMYAWGKTSNGYKQLGLVNAEDVKPSYLLPLTGFDWAGKDQEYFVLPATTQVEQYSRRQIVVPEKKIKMEDWLEFFGFYLADGCYRDHINTYGKRDYTVSIKQNESNQEYVLNLIDRIGFKAEISGGSKETNKNYNIYSKQLWEYLSQFGRSRDKYIPREFLNLSKYYLECLYFGYTNGDSYVGKTGQTGFKTVSSKLCENLQELILKVKGFITQVRASTERHSYDDGYVTIYNIHVNFNRKNSLYASYRKPEKIPYNDYVYCLTLEKNHIMLVRHNGKIGWCGNCFREYVAQLMEYDKKFLIIGSMNAITYKEIFPLLKDNKMWIGYTSPKEFIQPDGSKKKFGNILWYTNLDIPKRHEPLDLRGNHYHGNEDRYPRYDNYDAIECSKVSDIPEDYEPCWYKCEHAAECEYAQTEGTKDSVALCEEKCNGAIGVPITYAAKHNEQFEIIGATESEGSGFSNGLWDKEKKIAQPTIKLQKDVDNREAVGDNLQSRAEQSRAEQSRAEQSRAEQSSSCAFTRESSSARRKCNGIIGVPITMLDRFCAEQFEIIWQASGNSYANAPKSILKQLNFNPEIKYGGGLGAAISGGKAVYSRIFIRKKM